MISKSTPSPGLEFPTGKIDLVVMDWGIGGLSVYNEIRKAMPDLSILYFSDSGSTPYGKLSAAQLRSRICRIINHFHNHGIDHFVIACNAASTALPHLQKKLTDRGLKVTGVIEHAISMVKKTPHQRIGIIGGRRTILSRVYSRALQTKKRNILGRIAQPLSALIELGELNSPIMLSTLQTTLKPLKSCDALLMACTHYPAIREAIQAELPDCELLDPAGPTAHYVKNQWKFPTSRQLGKARNFRLACMPAVSIFMTTGDRLQMQRAARLAFANRIKKVQVIKI